MSRLIEKNRIFFDLIARYYDFFLKSWLGNAQRKIFDIIKIKKNSRILDVGCGTGNLLLELSKRKDLRLYGIDISKEMLKIAGHKLGKRARLFIMSAENIKFKDKFDFIFSTEAFHHYTNQKKAMKNFYKQLQKGGKLIILDLDFGKILNWLFNKIEPGNNRMNSKEDFARLFRETGFKKTSQKMLGLFSILTIGEK